MYFLALKHLLSRKKQTLLIVLGIFIGTMGYVVISGMILGVKEYLISQLINNDAHIKIMAREESITEKSITDSIFDSETTVKWIIPPVGRRGSKHIEYPQGWFDRLSESPNVVAYTPGLAAQVLYRRGQETVVGQITGTYAASLARITNINDNMVKGRFEDIGESGNRIVCGDGLLETVGARVNDTILISSGMSELQPFKITGSFHFGLPGIDDRTCFGALPDVQKLNNTPSEISYISVRLADVNQAGQIAKQWAHVSNDKVQSWEEANAQFLSAFKVQDGMRYVVTFAILIVAGFGIYNVLTIMVNQKKQEIAILRSIGFDSHDISKLFLTQGIILGVAGGLLGLLAGYLMCLYIGSIQVYPDKVMKGGKLPFSYNSSIYVIGFFLAFLSSIVASILPARAAGRMTPIDIIRQEAE